MQEELLQFKLHQVLDFWGIFHMAKEQLETYNGYYDEVFAPVARIKAIRLFLTYASFKDFVVYHMDVKSAFLYGKIEEEVYVCQPLGFKDLEFPDRVYKVEKALYRSTKKELCIEFEKLMHKKFQMSSMDKYVDEILKKFGFSTVKTASTPMETSKPLMKDEHTEDVDVQLYRSMIGSLMYLTSSRPNIMFDVCACARFQVIPKVLHLHDVKRIFRYLKGQPKLGLWYPKDSPFNLEAYTNSDYAGASLDRKSTTGGCQFLGSRLISWKCKKQTIVANSTTESEYVVAGTNDEIQVSAVSLTFYWFRGVGGIVVVCVNVPWPCPDWDEKKDVGWGRCTASASVCEAAIDLMVGTLIEIQSSLNLRPFNKPAATTTTTVLQGLKVEECSSRAKLNAELEDEEKLAKQREEGANIAEWDNVQAMIDADYEQALKNKSFDEVQKAFDKTMGWIDSFVSMDSEVVKGDK
ncbi:putative ribonuclease H-like domain-containing protein [Tanacetum coccineum]